MHGPHATFPAPGHPTKGWKSRVLLSLFLIALLCPAAARAAAGPAPLFAPGESLLPAAPVPTTLRDLAGDAEKNLSASADWEVFAGADFSKLGAAVGTVGDLNGDGFSDAAIGAPNMRDPGSARVGAVLIFFGSANGLPATASQILYGPHYASSYVEFGAALSPAGDIDGDGYADLLVGAPGYGTDGAAFVYRGTSGGLQTTYSWSYQLNDATAGSARFGERVSMAGDVDADGYDDVLVAAPQAWAGARGRALLFRGGATGLAAAPAWDRTGADLGFGLGWGLAAAGDVNGDGYDDVAVGTPGATGIAPPNWNTYYGEVSVYFGGPGGLDATPGSVTYGWQYGAGFGASVSGAGDMNGDGYADVAVGVPAWDSAWGSNTGWAFVLPGGAGGLGTSALWEDFGATDGDQFGAVLAPAGDVNGDGLGDLLIGSPNYGNGGGGLGLAAVVTGSRYGSIFMSWYRFDAGLVSFGAAVGTAGDVDGDGFSDILVGSPGFTGSQTLEGRAQLFLGAADAPAPAVGWMSRAGQSGSFYGWAVATAGDVNGDGFDDLLVSAPNLTFNSPNDGAVVLFFGAAEGLTTYANWFAIGPYSGSSFGYSVACAGDVNGDGYDDIAVGAPDYNHEGTVSVWYGGPAGPVLGAADWTFTGYQVGSHFGTSVASAGDVNGDGYADLIVGAPTDDSNWAGQTRPVDEGRAYLFLGSAGGLVYSGWTALGGQENSNLGNWVAGAGDVNGDGYGDVIVGQEAWDVPLGGGFSILDVGRALIYHGGAAGLAASPATVLQGNGNANFGHVVNTAGDVDGDGYSDVIVSAVYSDPSNQGSVAVYRGSAGGVSTAAHWSFTTGQAYSALGSSAGPAGDVNGDGLSDVVFGAVFHDSNGMQDNGKVWVFAGPLTGSAATTALREWSGSQSWENIGNSSAGAGDLNGDGFADIAAGSPGYTGSVSSEGRTVVWFANNRYQAGDTLARRGQQLRGDGLAPIGLGGLTVPHGEFQLQAYAGSAAGRTDVRLEWQVASFGTPFGGAVATGPWTENPASLLAEPLPLPSGPLSLPAASQAHWRLRVASRSPYFPHSPWVSPSRNGAQEADLRRIGTPTGVGDGNLPDLASSGLTAAPNPFNPRTRLAFDLPRDGKVRIELFDVRGRHVVTLLDEKRQAGAVTVDWNGLDGQGREVASGTYFARAVGGGLTATAKLTLVR